MNRHFMKRHFIKSQLNIAAYLLMLGLAIGAVTQPLPAQAATVALANAPLATSTTTAVKPNLLFVLDNSGSMDWDHMPDDAADGGSSVPFVFGYYGIRSSQCNQVYYDPDVTYKPPVNAAGISYADASFTGAYGGTQGGFPSSPTTVNLDTGFKANQSNIGGNAGGTDGTGGSAYYFVYSGTQDTQIEKNYNSTSNTFFSECNSANNASPGKDVFSKRRLASTATTTIVVSGTSGTPTVTSITACTQATAPACSANLLNAIAVPAITNSNSAVATSIAKQINDKSATTGYTASVSTSTVTITGPTNNSAANRIPVMVKTGTVTLTTDVFPDTAAASLTNFANWYSYYRTRMLMMKTAAGQAFSRLDNGYRVGLMKISSSSTPDVEVGTFWDNSTTSLGPTSTQRTTWYNTLYNTSTSGSTPLRTALSDAGRYFTGKLGGTDPVQYSCQQNFSILSTDGYWNAGDGYKENGSTAVGNQDGKAARPMFDGSITASTWTVTYTQVKKTKVTTGCGGQWKLKSQPQIGSCTVSTATASCTPSWSNNGSSTTTTSCGTLSTTSTPVETDRQQNTSGGSSNNLADIAMYYYQTDLRTPTLGNCGTAVSPATEGPLCENNVFLSSTDNNLQQHMTTFTLGLGASGYMNYTSDYLKNPTGDFAAVKLGSTASATVCTWQTSGVCNWPVPGMTGSEGLIANIDDLWHAAVNGRGAYFSATNPATLSAGLAGALNGIQTRRGSAAAAATSTLNPVANNNSAYFASYTTVEWKGNLESRGINTETGEISLNATWCVEDVIADTCTGNVVSQLTGDTTIYNCETTDPICSNGEIDFSGNLTSGTKYCKVPIANACTGTMNSKVAASSDTRTIKTANSSGTALIDFDAAYATANPSYFNAAKISTLSQWTTLDSTQQGKAVGTNLLNYLRGQYGYEDRTINDGPPDNKLYRYRSTVLGDVLESKPTFVSKPVFSYPYPGYSAFKSANASRVGTVFVGANDGMLHGIAESTGIERWAYVPSMVVPNMWKLADKNYSGLHVNFVNGSPAVSDVCTAYCTDAANAVWKTILVGGLNAGGRGYYALDITNPTAPALLWEITPTTGIGKVKDDDIGFSYGQPIITRKPDGTWVVLVSSGYNNVSPGDGKGYLYALDAGTGAIVSKITTGAGGTATPSGLAKMAGWNDEPVGNAVGYVYGGDLLGNVWRFNVNDTATNAAIGKGSVMKLASLFSDAAGANPQAVTTTPVLGKVAGKRIIFIGTGKYLETGDLTTTQIQTQYAIKDDDATTTLVNPRNTLVNQTLSMNADGTASRTASNNTVNFYTGRGWYVDFPDSGERVNVDSQLIQGVLVVPTVVPSNTACSPGGYSWLNFFNYRTGGAIDTSTNVASYKFDSTIVGGNVIYIDGQPQYKYVDSSGKMGDGGITFPPSAANFVGKRTLWRELIQ